MGRGRAEAEDRSSRSSRKRAASRSSAKSPARRWSAGQYDGPFDELPAQATSRPAIRPTSPMSALEQKLGTERRPRRQPTASSPGKTSARPKAPASSTSRPAAARKTSTSARNEVCRRSHRWTKTASSCPASGRSKAGRPSIPPRPTAILENLQKKGRAVRRREISAQLPALLALQDGVAVPPRRRVVHRHEMARRDHGRTSSRSTFLPESINGKARELDWLQQHGRLDDLEEALLGPGPADLGGRGNRRLRGDRLAGGVEDAGGRGLAGVRRPHAAPAVGGQDQNPQSEDRQPDVAHPGRRQPVAGRRHRAVFDAWATTTTANTGRSGSRPTSSPKAFPASSATGSTPSWR